MADIKNEPCVFYVGRELSCNGLYYRDNIKDVFLNNDGTAKTNAKNPTNADAYVYAYDNNNKLNLHIFKSCCYDKMICKYKAPDYVNEPLKLMSNVDGIWSKEIDCRSGEAPNEVIDADGTPYLTALVDYDDGFRISDNVSPEYINPNQEIICRYDFVESYFMDSPTDLERTSATGDYRFSGCTRLTECQLPCSMLTISDGTFSGCTNLVKYGNNSFIQTIGASAFTECTRLPKIVIGENVTSIGNNAFYDCTSATDLVFKGFESNNATFPYNTQYNSICLEALPNGCFNGCINLANTVVKRSDGSFNRITNALIIPNNIKTIGEYCFSGCSSISAIEIPSSVTAIGASAFSGCTSLSDVHITDLEAWCNLNFENRTSNPLHNNCRLFLNGSEVINLYLPNTVTSVGNWSFRNCISIETINFDGQEEVGDSTFSNCKYLTGVTNMTSVNKIGDNAFSNCNGLTEISFGGSLNGTSCLDITCDSNCNCYDSYYNNVFNNVGKFAFYACNYLTSVTIGDCITNIDDDAFYECDLLSNIYIGKNVCNIGRTAFYNASANKTVYCYAQTPPNLNTVNTSFNLADSSTSTLYVPRGLRQVYENSDWYTFFDNIIEM